MNGDPRDPLDDAIAHDLGSLAPDDIDADAVLGAMRPTLHRARARRRLAIASGALGTVVVLVGIVGVLGGQSPGRIDVQGHPTTLPAPSSTSSTTRTSTTPTTRASTSTTTATTPTTDDHAGTSQPGSGSTTTPTFAPPSTKTYSSIGGRVTVTFANGALTLDSSMPAAGYQTDVHKQDPDDVEVRFSNANRESRIRIRVQSGAVQKEITES